MTLLTQWLNKLLSGMNRKAKRNSAPKSSGTDKASPRLPMMARACASVIIPALNEEKRIAEVVAYALSDPATAEVIVIDDSSTDNTVELARKAGATVITSTMLGKGASMRDGVTVASGEILAYLDGDLAGLQPGIITALCQPILMDDVDFVKARFGRSSGRVTELTAKPMLRIFFPELAEFAQPLGGIIAATKSLLRTLRFEEGYGVDVGLLIDAQQAGAKLAEVDIGSLQHDSQQLADLTLMANEVSRVIFARARAAGRLHVEQIAAMYESQRQATASMDYVLTRRKGRKRLLLLDMDGTITPSRYVMELAQQTGHENALLQLLDGQHQDSATRSQAIAGLFRYVHKEKFERAARGLAIRPGVIQFVNLMRRRGFMVGIVSDSYFVAAEILRRRIFADFALAHTIQFDNDICTGQIQINPAFVRKDLDGNPLICKSQVLQNFRADLASPPIDTAWVVGDNLNDLELMRLADQAFAIEPKSAVLSNTPGIRVIDSFESLTESLVTMEILAPAPPRVIRESLIEVMA